MRPSQALEAGIAHGKLADDAGQRAIARHLDALITDIESWNGGRSGLFSRSRPAPRGLYLWGGVGTGKSLLMDLFHDAVALKAKRRAHFHAFMQDVHARIARERETRKGEPLIAVADEIARETRLLCFDELQVTNVADAMILGRLFERLFDKGVVVIATSNRHPSELYKNGLNRQLFEPFIAMIEAKLEVMRLDSGRDYRLERLTAAPVYYTPLDADADAAMDAAFDRLTLGARAQSCTLTIQGRTLEVASEAAGVARFGFAELCARPLGAADYLTLADTFHTLLIDHVPVMSPAKRDEAARFVTLIDALYDTRAKLVMSAEAPPQRLYPAGDGAFEFERTASRLMEMQSAEYLAAERRSSTTDASSAS
ncbi:AFG1 family ATPase [Glycocaulis alkaliphilus]|uniref:AFG1 family ATPase n=1 Tax=Glycocaulis alkaliphilus TaxID=1434191 RepID=A0A3T0E5J2_9PROT|nr:cell division protein ZapE [Glycocaulis alkaliphilus]AZU02572.1 AFG1 family ATPase [Glycocaulis alkaliphilus]GGB80665.1 cell division protein ZapE [Glycocaulis alkaliphilus]